MANSYGFATDTTNWDKATQEYISRLLIQNLRAKLSYAFRGSVIGVTQVPGMNFIARHLAVPDVDIPDPSTPLTEGAPPSATKLGIDDVEVTLSQFGAYVPVSDLAQASLGFGAVETAAERMGRQAAVFADEVARLAIAAHAADDDDNTAILSTDRLLDGVATLKGIDVDYLPGGELVAVGHPYAFRGLLSETGLAGFVAASQYAAPKQLINGELGTYRGVRLVETSRGTQPATGGYRVDIYGANTLLMGDIATLQIIVKQNQGAGDPLNQLASAGWKALLGAKLVKVANDSDGAGTNGSQIDRIYSIVCKSGRAVDNA